MRNYTKRYQTAAWSAAVLALAIASSSLAAQDAPVLLKSAVAVTSFSPTSGVKGTQVTLSGLNLSGVTAVRFGATAAPLRSKTSTTIVTNVPDLPVGSYIISVTTIDGDVGKPGFTVTSPLQIASSLKAAGESADSVAHVLKAAPYLQTGEQMGLIEAQVGFGAKAIAHALVFWPMDSEATAKILRSAGFDATASASAELNTYYWGVYQIARDLRAAGYVANDIASAMRVVFARSAQETASILSDVGFASSEIASAERVVYGTSAAQTAVILKAVRFGILDIYKAVTSVFSVSKTEAISILQSIGFTLADINAAIG